MPARPCVSAGAGAAEEADLFTCGTGERFMGISHHSLHLPPSALPQLQPGNGVVGQLGSIANPMLLVAGVAAPHAASSCVQALGWSACCPCPSQCSHVAQHLVAGTGAH